MPPKTWSSTLQQALTLTHPLSLPLVLLVFLCIALLTLGPLHPPLLPCLRSSKVTPCSGPDSFITSLGPLAPAKPQSCDNSALLSCSPPSFSLRVELRIDIQPASQPARQTAHQVTLPFLLYAAPPQPSLWAIRCCLVQIFLQRAPSCTNSRSTGPWILRIRATPHPSAITNSGLTPSPARESRRHH